MQGQFEGLFLPLLRLASSQFPHLCLVEDWLIEQRTPTMLARLTSVPGDLNSALDNVVVCPVVTNLHLQHLASISSRLAWYRATSVLLSSNTAILDHRVPVLDLANCNYDNSKHAIGICLQ